MDAVVMPVPLNDARIARQVVLDRAKAEFERAVAAAAAVAAARERTANLVWERDRKRARLVAGVRAGLWRQYSGLDTQDLLQRLALHELELTPAYGLRSKERSAQLWYVRMIRSELARRARRENAA